MGYIDILLSRPEHIHTHVLKKEKEKTNIYRELEKKKVENINFLLFKKLGFTKTYQN